MTTNLRAIVLAAGEGRRLSGVTGGVPKQFWRPGTRPSLLNDTMSRLAPLVAHGRMTVVVDRSHERYIGSIPADVRLVLQPRDRGTAAGVLLGLNHVLATDEKDTVILTPSDHAVRRPDLFRAGLLTAAAAVAAGETDIVLFGAEPFAAYPDFGWITPGAIIQGRQGSRLRRVAGFVEKPVRDCAIRLFESGSVWNTMVLVARADALAALFARHLPGLSRIFAAARTGLAETREAFLDECYEAMASSDFSRDLLARAENLLLFTWAKSVGWTDLGTPDRLERWEHTVPARTNREIA